MEREGEAELFFVPIRPVPGEMRVAPASRGRA